MRPFSELLKEAVEDAVDLKAIDLRKMYREFNSKYFGNALPDIPVGLGNIKAGGLARGARGKISRITTPKEIVISTRYKMSMDRLRNILAHEMVHVWTWVTENDKYGGMHNGYFLKKMKELNDTYGFHITVTDENPEVSEEHTSKKDLGAVLLKRDDTNTWSISVYDLQREPAFIDRFANRRLAVKVNLYLIRSKDAQLLKFPRPRMQKNMTFYTLDTPTAERILKNSTIVSQGEDFAALFDE